MPEPAAEPPHPWGPHMHIGKVFLKGNERTKWDLDSERYLNQEWLSSYSEKIRAGSISISDYEGVHDLSLNVGWRDLLPRRDSKIPTAYRASPSILAEAMPSTKTSVKYVFTDDNRNNVVYPTAGGLFKYTTEIAGLVGDVKFVKAEVEGQKHVAALGLRGQLFANAGNLTTWDRLLDEKKWMKNLADDTRVSVGVGLVWGTRIGRLEANYSWILKAHDHDNIKRAQLGLGMTFC
ncbi:hypothetical protein AM588_10011007 [Phytophthora nicotianae]|uniref:Bacterial surface antigen (D15) domain-containing protein n=1 Tax=Phytophthora nicotianae TaxID=4792 RepID=A0A0W8DLM4_PHYNI|nr:hypothetical protein AM588_10011007 [Phytophthora nicotianae]